MATYFQTLTPGGEPVVQIDDDFVNLAFMRKSTHTISPGGTLTVSQAGSTPVMAVKCEYNLGVSLISRLGGTYTWLVSNFSGSENGVSNRSVVVTCYFFDKPPSIARASGVGLQIFNGLGEPIYDSANRYLRAEDYGRVVPGGGSISYSRDLDPLRSFAAVALSDAVGYQALGFPPGPGPFFQKLESRSTSVFRTRTTNFFAISVTVSQNITPPQGTALPSSDFYSTGGGTGQYLIVDVTGY